MASNVGEIVGREDSRYDESLAAWNSLYTSHPKEVLYPATTEEVQAAVLYARRSGLPFRIRSGGHSFDGYSSVDDGIVISLARFDTIEVSEDDATVVVGPGARLHDVYAALSEHDLAIPGGTCGGVGAGGVSLGGGIGLLARSHGWLAQSIRSIKMVDANGDLLTVDKDNHPDLFWALRGAGGNNFGVVISLTIEAYRIPRYVQGLIAWDWQHLVEFTEAFQNWLPTLHGDINALAALESKSTGHVVLNVSGSLPQDQIEREVAPLLAQLPPPQDQKYASTSYADAIHEAIDPATLYSPEIRATTVMGCSTQPMTWDLLERLRDHLAVAEGETGVYLYGLGHDAEAHRNDPVSVPHLGALLSLYARIYWTDTDKDAFHLSWMSALAEDVLPYLETTYINSHDIHIDGRVYPRYGESFARLVKVKSKYDPENVFSFIAGIPPTLSVEDAHRLSVPDHQIEQIREFGLLKE